LTWLCASKPSAAANEPITITRRSWPESIQRPTAKAIRPSANKAKANANEASARDKPSSVCTGPKMSEKV